MRDPTTPGVARLSPWLRNILAALPVFVLIFWLAERFRKRRTQVSQRAPRSSPLHTTYVADAVLRFSAWDETHGELARALQQRDQYEIPIIDPDASIKATLAQGGRIFELRNRTVRPAPEYLVLIEQRSPGDQQAQYMRALLEPLRARAVAHFDVYYFQTEPSWLTPERGGRPVHISLAKAHHPNHRLIVMGTGRGWLRTSDQSVLPSVDYLRDWDRRAILTPTPMADWGQTEPVLARELEVATVGRATPRGFGYVATLMALEGQRPTDMAPMDAGQDVRLLDGTLRLRPHRFLNNHPPDDIDVDQIVDGLCRFLDDEGFQWLCALAVYPGLQWELTLYLGLDQRFRQTPLYTPDADGTERLGRLLQLPWLQAGRMPNWLRVRLISEMESHAAGRVYAALSELFRSAQKTGTETSAAEGLLLRIGRDLPLDLQQPQRLEDEIMFDFMHKGDQGAFVLPDEFDAKLTNSVKAVLQNREVLAGICVSLLCLTVLLGILPAHGQPLETGAWLPLIAFVSCGAVLTAVVLTLRLLRNRRIRTPAS